MICKNCGFENPGAVQPKYCSGCGVPLQVAIIEQCYQCVNFPNHCRGSRITASKNGKCPFKGMNNFVSFKPRETLINRMNWG